jgi:predicted N-acetyltransferase YhbS
MCSSNLRIAQEAASDASFLSRLSAEAFGPGRFARSAYRVREGVAPVAGLSLTARLDGRIVGGVRFTRVRIGGEDKALLLGPLVVDPVHKGNGFGVALVREGLARASAAGYRLVVLVGDMPYYGRFGFKPVPPGQIRMPGPVDPNRLLALELVPGALASASGLMEARSG